MERYRTRRNVHHVRSSRLPGHRRRPLHRSVPHSPPPITPPKLKPHPPGSLAIVIYAPGSGFSTDLQQQLLPQNLDHPGAFPSNPFGGVVGFNNWMPPTNPAVGQAPPNEPLPPIITIGPPVAPPDTASSCAGPSGCGSDQVCQVTQNRLGTEEGCVAAVDALLGMAYDFFADECANGGPGRCLLSTPPPPPASVLQFRCACNCTYTSRLCCSSSTGIVWESYSKGQLGALTAPEGQCCDLSTGGWADVPKGGVVHGNNCPTTVTAPSASGDGINVRRIRGMSKRFWDVVDT